MKHGITSENAVEIDSL